MSAIALVNVVSGKKLDQFLDGRCSWKAVVKGSEELPYKWSGYVLGTVVPYLDEQGIVLSDPRDATLSEAKETSCFVLTTEHRRFLDQLDPARFAGDKLRDYYEAFNETSAPGIENAMLAGIQLFRDVISRLRDDTVGVIVIA